MRVSDPASPEFLYRRHVEKVLASAPFKRADRLGQFLTFVVEKQIAAETGALKETSIGTQVYGRAAGYDPKIDPIVRTEARRLRRKLDEYAQEYGQQDQFVLKLPTGGYAPVFEVVSEPLAPERTLPSGEMPSAVISPEHVTLTSRSRLLWGLGVLMALALSLGLVILWRWNASPLQSAAGTVTPLTSYPGVEFFPSISPDGESVAFVWNGTANNFDIYVKKLGEETARRVTKNPAHDIQPAWSPDGKELAFLRCWPDNRVELITIPVAGGEEHIVQVLHPARGNWEPDASIMRRHPGIAWLSDGMHLVTSDRCGPAAGSSDCLYSFSREGMERQRLTTPTEGTVGDSLPALSPNGKQLSFVRMSSERQISELVVRNMADGAIHQVTSDGKTVSAAAWLSNDKVVFLSNRAGGNHLWTVSVPGGKPQVLSEAGRAVGSLAASRDGSRIVYSESFRNSNLWSRDISVTTHAPEPVKVISSSGTNDSAAYSPDGLKIVFMSNRSGTPEVWLASADGSNPMILTQLPKATPVGSPRWSPDSRSLVFDSAREGHSVILTMNATAGSTPAVFAGEPGDNMMPTWSRDGKWIYYLRRQSGAPAVWRKSLTGGGPILIAPQADSEAYETQDGRSLIYIRGEAIEETSSAGGLPAQVLVSNVTPSRHLALGARGIFFVPSARDAVPRVEYYELSTRRRQTIFSMSRPLMYNSASLAVSPDEKRLLYAQLDDSGSDLMLLQVH